MNPDGIFGMSNNWALIPPLLIVNMAIFYGLLKPEQIKIRQIIVFYSVMSLVNFAGAKLFSLYFRDWQLMSPLIRELQGGWRHPGALVTTLLFGPLLIKRCFHQVKLWHSMDAFVVAFCGFVALMRISCFLNGCCTGDICDEWYCLTYPKGSAVWFHQVNHFDIYINATQSLPVFPAHLLLGGLEIIATLLLCWVYYNRRFNGQTVICFLILQGLCKAIAESYKTPYMQELQVAAVLTVIAGCLCVLITWRHWVFWKPEVLPCTKTSG